MKRKLYLLAGVLPVLLALVLVSTARLDAAQGTFSLVGAGGSPTNS